MIGCRNDRLCPDLLYLRQKSASARDVRFFGDGGGEQTAESRRLSFDGDHSESFVAGGEAKHVRRAIPLRRMAGRDDAQALRHAAGVGFFEDGGFEIVLNDITQQEKTKRLKQEMTGNIAHELRTPVTSIRGYLETVLETSLPPEKEHDFIRKAYRQTLSLSELIRDMSLLTKIENSADSFHFAQVRLDTVIDRVVMELEPAMNEKRIVLHNELPAGLTVSGNESLIYSVFRNLTDNVIHHADSGVTITIALRDRRDGYLYLSFADNGRGIAEPEKLNRLFERFYRVDEGRTRDNGGSGLGLSIVRNIISLHKGTITVCSGRNGGLDFLFSLPVYQRPDPAA